MKSFSMHELATFLNYQIPLMQENNKRWDFLLTSMLYVMNVLMRKFQMQV